MKCLHPCSSCPKDKQTFWMHKQWELWTDLWHFSLFLEVALNNPEMPKLCFFLWRKMAWALVKTIVVGHIWCLGIMVGMFILIPVLFDTFLTLLSHRSRWPFSRKKKPSYHCISTKCGIKKKKKIKKILTMTFLLLSYQVHCRWTGTKHQEIKCKE